MAHHRDPALPSVPEPSVVPTFTPVPGRLVAGWTAAKQRMFIEALAATGSVRLSTESVGMNHTHIYTLRHAPGGESFARAWDEAVTLAARRVRDVLIDQAIHGIPERVLIGRDTVVERRRFNHRTMIWVLQHHMADLYPGGSTTHRRGWGERPPMAADELRDAIARRLAEVGRPEMAAIAADPAKRAAYELLHGPQRWDADAPGNEAGDA